MDEGTESMVTDESTSGSTWLDRDDDGSRGGCWVGGRGWLSERNGT